MDQNISSNDEKLDHTYKQKKKKKNNLCFVMQGLDSH